MLYPLKNSDAWNLGKAVTNFWGFICIAIKAYPSSHPSPEPTSSHPYRKSLYLSSWEQFSPDSNWYLLEWPCPPIFFFFWCGPRKLQAVIPQLCVPGLQMWLEIWAKHRNKSKAEYIRAPGRGSRQHDASSCVSKVRCILRSLGMTIP